MALPTDPKVPTTPTTRGPAGPVGPSGAFPDNPKAASIDRATGRPAELATGPTVPDPKISPDAAAAKNADRPLFFGGGTLMGQTAIPEKAVRDRNELRIRHADGTDIYTLADPGFSTGDSWQYSRTEPIYRAPVTS